MSHKMQKVNSLQNLNNFFKEVKRIKVIFLNKISGGGEAEGAWGPWRQKASKRQTVSPKKPEIAVVKSALVRYAICYMPKRELELEEVSCPNMGPYCNAGQQVSP